MPELNELFKDQVKTEIKWGENTVSFSYRPSGYTPEVEAAAKMAEQEPGQYCAYVLSRILSGWDVLQNGAPYPLDEQSLRKLPVPFLQAVFLQIIDSAGPNPQTAGS